MPPEIADELSKPLGRKKLLGRLSRLYLNTPNWPFGRIMLGVLLVILGMVFIRVIQVDDPAGGRPSADVEISNVRSSNTVVHDVGSNTDQSSMTVGEEFIPDQIPPSDGAGTTNGGAPLDEDLADRTLNDFGAYPALLEDTQHGPVPHIGANGERPFDAYARASIGPEAANGKPLVAVIVTGLGLNESATIDAISKLPDNITLAFAPYGGGLQRSVGIAQAEGHEFWLEVPMEPFDYPESDPGPHTLLINQPVRTNLDKLMWLMGRFGGYAGIINNLGARFSSTPGDFGPIMEEIGTRGLGYVDDGSSNRSLARQLAIANGVPFARANLQIDAKPNRAAILAALDRLREAAETEGSAVGVISALPVSVDTVAAWAGNLEETGLTLVPISALAAQGQ